MIGTDVPALDAVHRAALSGGKPLVCVCPPTWWCLSAILSEIPANSAQEMVTIVLVPEIGEHHDLEHLARSRGILQPVHTASGIARTARLLRSNSIACLIVTPLDLMRLIEMSCLRVDPVKHIIVAWPEAYDGPSGKACDAALSELKGAARIIATADRDHVNEFLERHARRAAIYEVSPGEIVIRHPVRYAIVASTRRPWAVATALDITNPRSAVFWDPLDRLKGNEPIGLEAEDSSEDRVELAIAIDLPTPAVLQRLAARAEAVLVLVQPSQAPHLLAMAPEAQAIRLPSAGDRARHAAFLRRAELRERLESMTPMGILTTLEPLLDEFDPVMIAAAALAEPWDKTTEPDDATWTTIRVDKGTKDGVRARDLVGALANAVGLRTSDVGRIDLRSTFSLIEIRPEDAARATRGLTGLQVRGQRLSARLDDARRAGSEGSSPTSRSKRP